MLFDDMTKITLTDDNIFKYTVDNIFRYYQENPDDDKRYVHDFQVGDTVVIRWDMDEAEKKQGASFIEDMERYAGKTAHIVQKNTDALHPGYRLDVDKGYYIWQDQMLYSYDWIYKAENQHEQAIEEGDFLKCLNVL